MSALFGFNDAWPVVAWAVFTFFQISSYSNTRGRAWYDRHRPSWGPPGWMFPIIWFILYAACTVAIYYFTKNAAPDSWNIILGVVMYIVHMLANKFWSVLFFDMNDPESAVNVLVFVMIPTGVALLISFIIDQTGIYWVPVMLLSIYLAWLVFLAAPLNVHWVNKRLGTNDEKSYRSRVRGVTYERD